MHEQLLGVPQAAKRLGVDQSTVHRRIARGTMTPALWVGRRPLFRAADIEAMKPQPAEVAS